MTELHTTVDREKRQIVMARIFDAPRELVFKTYTDPTLVPQWWSGNHARTRVDKMDVKPGGIWRYVQSDSDGNEFAFHGTYQEVVPPERLTYTFEYEGMPGKAVIETITFEEHAGKTKLTDTSYYQTLEELEAMLQTGAEQGANDSWNALAELLRQLQSSRQA